MIEPSGEVLHLQANGLNHRLLRYGEAERTVIILPGITSPALTAEFIALDLSTDFTVHVPDLRGRGGTETPPAGHYSLDDYAADVEGLVAALELVDPVIVGHSLGARIAAAYSARSKGGHSDLILVDPPLSGPGREPYPTTRDDFSRQLEGAYGGTTVEEVRAFYPRWATRELEIRVQELSSCDRLAVLETHERFHTEDFVPLWTQIRQPALLIRGALSPVVTEKRARELAELNPRVPIVSVPDAGHMVPWDNWPGFSAALRNRLKIDRSPA